jgi:4,5-dihydroxyphthalate decarboxylase
MMEILTLDTAIRTTGLTLPLKDGRVVPDGVRFNHIEVVPHIAAFRRMVRGLEFDVSELAPVTYVLSQHFKKQLIGIPVFLQRGFHHHRVVCHPNSGIKTPKDLEGKKVGIRAFSVSAWIWFFGMLHSDYGVDPSKITFVTDDEDHVQEFVPPANSYRLPEGTSLVEQIALGNIDAAFTGNAGLGRIGAPDGAWGAREAEAALADVGLYPLFPDAEQLEIEWHRRTGVLPIHGVIVIKNSVLEAHPQVGPAVYDAFAQARKLYLDDLERDGARFKEDKAVLRLRDVLGEEPLPFGFETNRRSITALADYAYALGLVPEHFTPEDLFSPTTQGCD